MFIFLSKYAKLFRKWRFICNTEKVFIDIMFKFNISEEIIFNIKNGKFRSGILKDNEVIRKLLQNIKNNRVRIFTGIYNSVLDKLCSALLYKIFMEIYAINMDVDVFRVFSIDEIDSLYLEDKFQIFYLYDFFAEISLCSGRYNEYFDRIINTNNKILIVNTRYIKDDSLLQSRFNYLVEDTSIYLDCIEDILNDFVKHDYQLDLHKLYKNLTYIDKVVLFFVFIGISCDINTWIETMEKYLMYRDNIDFRDRALNAFKKLEGEFISFNRDKRFYIENPLVSNFLRDRMVTDKGIIKDILNNIYCEIDLYNITNMLNENNIFLHYSEYEYERYLKGRLLNIFCVNNLDNVVLSFEYILKFFNVIELFDLDIIGDLSNKIIYSKINIDNAIEYMCFIKHNKEHIIWDDIFRNKLLNLIYEYDPNRDFEFYNYSFKYFLFISEFHSLYGNMEEEEILDLQNRFNILINIILNNVNSYFTIDYFSLSNEVKHALIDLKGIIGRYNINNIFDVNIYEILIYIEDKLVEVLNDVVNFIPCNINEYHILVYFNNELEHNKDFIEDTFDNIVLDNVVHKIKEKIHTFKA